MAAEAGHAPNAVYLDQSGNLHLNGASLFNASEVDIKTAPGAVAAGYKIARGQQTTVAAADTVVTGLATVVAVVATFEDDVDGVTISQVTAQVGNQSGAPAAGSIIIKTWKATSTANPTLIAATTFSKKVNWVAIGT
jgi:hypothetical protein